MILAGAKRRYEIDYAINFANPRTLAAENMYIRGQDKQRHSILSYFCYRNKLRPRHRLHLRLYQKFNA